jgi:hypothetical protein
LINDFNSFNLEYSRKYSNALLSTSVRLFWIIGSSFLVIKVNFLLILKMIEVRKAGHFLTSFDLDKCQRIIQKIDDCVPENWNTYRLPQSRKDLICKLVTLRAEKLKSLLS